MASRIPQSPYCIGFRRVFRLFKGNSYVALRGQVVNFVGLNPLNGALQAGAVRHVAVMQMEFRFFDMRIGI